MATTVPIEGQFRPGLRLNISMWMRDPSTFLVPPRRTLQEALPPVLQGVVSQDEWAKFRGDVGGAFEPLREKLKLWWPLGNVGSVAVPTVLAISILRFVFMVLASDRSGRVEGVGDEPEELDYSLIIQDMISRYWNLVLLILCMPLVFIKAIHLPRVARQSQPFCHQRVETICAEMSATYPSMTFALVKEDLVQNTYFGRGQTGGYRINYVNVGIYIGVAGTAGFQVGSVPVVVATAVPVQATAVPVQAVPVAAVAVPVEATPVEATTVGAQEERA